MKQCTNEYKKIRQGSRAFIIWGAIELSPILLLLQKLFCISGAPIIFLSTIATELGIFYNYTSTRCTDNGHGYISNTFPFIDIA